jgi:hypothetical protein
MSQIGEKRKQMLKKSVELLQTRQKVKIGTTKMADGRLQNGIEVMMAWVLKKNQVKTTKYNITWQELKHTH